MITIKNEAYQRKIMLLNSAAFSHILTDNRNLFSYKFYENTNLELLIL